jgi:hypothetical protein
MPSAAKLKKRAVNKQAHAIARSAVNTSVDPAEIAGRIFTTKEEEELPLHMRDGNVMRRGRGTLTNEASVNRVCDLIARGVTETDARRYVGVCATEWGQWRRHNECHVNEKLAFAIDLQHVATADECVRLLSELRAERRTALKSYNEAMRAHQREMSEWYAVPKDVRGERPVEPVYDGPTELDMRMDVAMVTHLQWKLESLSKQHTPKKETSLNVNQNIFQEIMTATSEQDAMRSYIQLIDNRSEG